ncbi:hypothetical protein C8R48DRAFT_774778 [Suillus tomentosus]|nr:hypothetical protein C8R48DRAFT_774778 [Suillus tomentosus]
MSPPSSLIAENWKTDVQVEAADITPLPDKPTSTSKEHSDKGEHHKNSSCSDYNSEDICRGKANGSSSICSMTMVFDLLRIYRKSFHDHDPSVHLDAGFQPDTQEPPEWAKELMNGMIKPTYAESAVSREQYQGEIEYSENMDQYGSYQNETAIIVKEDDELYGDHTELQQQFGAGAITETWGGMSEFLSGDRDDSPGQQFLEEELYKLRVKPGGDKFCPLAFIHDQPLIGNVTFYTLN